jgi:hypothetical protein
MATTNPKYNLRNPLPLSAAQEAEVKQLYYKRVRAHCAPEIKGAFPFSLLIVQFLLGKILGNTC